MACPLGVALTFGEDADVEVEVGILVVPEAGCG